MRDESKTSASRTRICRTIARIDVDPRGGPVRLIINGRHRKPTGRWSSSKCRRAMPWEGRGERDLCILCEADATIVSFLTQPHRFTMKDSSGRVLVYWPDMRIDHADGSVTIVEVKKGNESPDPFYEAKVAAAGKVYESLGWRYTRSEHAQLRRGPGLANARRICRDKDALVSAVDVMAATALFEDALARPTYGQVAQALGEGPTGTAKLHALVVRRTLALDIHQYMDEHAPVRLVADRRDQGAERC